MEELGEVSNFPVFRYKYILSLRATNQFFKLIGTETQSNFNANYKTS